MATFPVRWVNPGGHNPYSHLTLARFRFSYLSQLKNTPGRLPRTKDIQKGVKNYLKKWVPAPYKKNLRNLLPF